MVKLIVLGAFSLLVGVGLFWGRRRRRERFLAGYRFPASIKEKVRARYPHLTDQDLYLVLKGLREYFQICNMAGRRMVSMPSQVVDVAWHELILFTRQYQEFCRRGLGRFLHHVPAEAMSSPTLAQIGIKRAWRLSCLRENIRPSAPDRLPLLFVIDSRLKIADGFYYSRDCKTAGDGSYCGSHIGCGSGGCASGCAGESSGCGGGCGGD